MYMPVVADYCKNIIVHMHTCAYTTTSVQKVMPEDAENVG